MFGFKSITHRLIFGSVVAAIAIFSLSYYHGRRLTRDILISMTIDGAKTRIDTMVAEIEGNLQSVEQSTEILAQAVRLSQKYPEDTIESIPLLLQTLVEQQSKIQAVALLLPRGENETVPYGWRYDRTDGHGHLGRKDEDTSSIARCPVTGSTADSFWSLPHALDDKKDSLGITYCTTLSQTNLTNQEFMGTVAVTLTLDWLPPLVTPKLHLLDGFNEKIEMGDPFLISQLTGQWIVSPSPQTQTNFKRNTNIPDIVGLPGDESVLDRGGLKIISDEGGTLVFTNLRYPKASKERTPLWLLGIAFPVSDLRMLEQNYLWIMTILMVKDLVAICLAIVLVSQYTTRPLRALITNTEDMALGNLDTILPTMASRDEVGRLTAAFRRMRDALKARIEELRKTTAAKQKLESELSIAGEIQRTMVPQIDVADGANRGYLISALLKPARMVGGDLYDFFLLGEDRLCFTIGDVADKGVPAALLMARTVTLIRTMAKPTSTPVTILEAINSELCFNNEECLFVTLFCGVLNMRCGTLHYASGGHDAPLLIRDGRVRLLPLETGPSLGLDEEAVFPQKECLLKCNDLLLLYTDGITEAMNPQGELFSESRLIDTIARYPPSNPSRAIRTVQYFHRKFVEDAPQSDDITLLTLQYLPSSPFAQEEKVVEWSIAINSELTKLERVKQRLAEILQEKYLTIELIEDAQLIVEEILVNIIEYGGASRSDCCIDLRVKITSETLSMIFEDSGKPFNPLALIDAPDFSVHPDERALGGLGFYLVRELSDRLDYDYRNGKNLLTVCRSIPQS